MNNLFGMKMNRMIFCVLLGLSLVGADAQGVKPYAQDFEACAPDSIPEEFLVLDGLFTVKAESGKKFLELPGAPLDTYGLLFGGSEKMNHGAQAQFHGTSKGRRFPTFAVGINGAGGFKLQVSPAKKMIELFQGEEVKATAPFEWKSDSWTHLKLEMISAKPGEWKVVGRAWLEGAPEPTEPTVAFNLSAEPSAGRASIWGSPFSGTPIRFDNLKVFAVNPK